MFLSIYNRSLGNTWGFVPMSADEVRHMAGGLRYVIIPEMAIAAEIDGQVAGATFGLLDYNPRIKEIDGRLFPFGFIHLLRNRRAIKAIRVISTNVLPEYQRLGVGLVLMAGLVPKVLEWGVQEAEFSWVLESNSLSYGSLKKGGAKITKTYRLYDWEAAEVAGGAEVGGREGEEEKGEGTAQCPPAVSPPHAVRRRPLGNPPGSRPRRSQPVPQIAVADLRRRSAVGAAACCWTSRSSSTAASIRSISMATPRSSLPSAARKRWDACWSAMIRCATSSTARTSAASACSSASTTRRPPTPCWMPPPIGSAPAAGPTIRGPIDYSLNYPLRTADRRFRHAAADHDES